MSCAARPTLSPGRIHMLYRSSICAVALMAVLLATPAAAQVVDFGKYPDFKGQWSRPAVGNPNNWIRLGGPPPLTPEYQKVWDEITADLKAGGPGNWPSTFCVHQGMPAMMSIYSPAEFIVLPDVTWILVNHNNDMHRRIYTDGRAWPEDAEPTYAAFRWASGSTRTVTANTTCSRSRRVSSKTHAATIRRAFRSTPMARPSSRNGSTSTRLTAT